MASAKDLRVAPIRAADARRFISRNHYSGKVVNNSQLHFGVFLDKRLQGAMQFGPSTDKRRTISLVSGTKWNGFLELNRMAFSQLLPRNSESRAIGVALRIIRKHYPEIEWILSYADATQCGDGAIYRASGFVLTKVEKNTTLYRMPNGEVCAQLTFADGHKGGGAAKRRHGYREGEGPSRFLRRVNAVPIPGFQLRYIYFLNPAARERLTVPILPFSRIAEMGATMYRGERTRPKQATPETIGEAAGQHRPGRSNSQPEAI